MIIKVSDKTIEKAAEILSISWKDSHKDFCSRVFTSFPLNATI